MPLTSETPSTSAKTASQANKVNEVNESEEVKILTPPIPLRGKRPGPASRTGRPIWKPQECENDQDQHEEDDGEMLKEKRSKTAHMKTYEFSCE